MATEIIRKGTGASRLMNREEYFHIADSDHGYVSELVRGIREKTQDYFDAGALRVWIVDPEALPGFVLEMGFLGVVTVLYNGK